MTTPCKISVTALVVVGAKEIISTGKTHDETTDVKSVISPPSLKELIEAALAGVAKRGLSVVSRSTLRVNVKKVDPAKRDFKDKDEWKKVLKVLQEAGKLTYDAVNDSISLPA